MRACIPIPLSRPLSFCNPACEPQRKSEILLGTLCVDGWLADHGRSRGTQGDDDWSIDRDRS
jgi:hypothetical protein